MMHDGLENLLLYGELVLDLFVCDLRAGGHCILYGI